MKKIIKVGLIILFIVLANTLPPMRNMLIFFFEWRLYPDSDEFVTKNKKFAYSGNISLVGNPIRYRFEKDYYSIYKKTFPNEDTILYRIEKINLLKFWRWGEYIFSPKWHRPHIEMSYAEWDKIFNNMSLNRVKYGTPFPRDTTAVFKK